jgi:glycine cleavage system H protein
MTALRPTTTAGVRSRAVTDSPERLKYTAEHEWVDAAVADGRVRFGITDFAQAALGDIVYVSLPEVGAQVAAGSPVGEVESTKSVSDLYAPVSGTVVARNSALESNPDLINSDPYGEGWMVEVEPDDPTAVEGLLDAAAYAALTAAG